MALASLVGILNASGIPQSGPAEPKVNTIDTAVDLVKLDTADAKTKIGTAKTATALVKTGTLAAVAAVPSYTTFAADLATLVSDGAVPTQGHVNTVDADWTTLKAAIDAYIALVATANTNAATADTGTGTAKTAVDLSDADGALLVTASQAGQTQSLGGAIVTIDLVTVTTVSKLRKLFNSLLVAASGSGWFTE